MNNIEDLVYILQTTRQRLADNLWAYSNEQLNKIVPPYKNNVIWNAAHCLVTQNLLTYGLADLPLEIDNFWLDHFRKGTAPTTSIEAQKVEELTQQLLKSPEKLLEHYKSGHFVKFKVYETSYGIILNNIEQAIAFNNTHEGLHLGYIMAMRKML